MRLRRPWDTRRKDTVRRLLVGFTLFLLLALLATSAPFTPSASAQSISQLRAQLRRAQAAQDRAEQRVAVAVANVALAQALRDSKPADDPGVAEAQLAAALLVDGIVTNDEITTLTAKESAARKVRNRWAAKVRSLKRQIARQTKINAWNRRGQWTPLIKIASQRYGVSAAGLKRLMILESSGNRYAGTTYKGLYQYYPGTWRGSWNPWRAQSIYNGWAQIRATAYALRRGMGPSHWPNTYWRAF